MAFCRRLFLRYLRILAGYVMVVRGFRKGRKSVNLTANRTHDVLGANIANQQSIGDERAVTAPGHRFGAHQCDPVLFRQVDQFLHLSLKFRGLHVIRIASKGGIPPTHVERIAPRMTQSASPGM